MIAPTASVYNVTTVFAETDVLWNIIWDIVMRICLLNNYGLFVRVFHSSSCGIYYTKWRDYSRNWYNEYSTVWYNIVLLVLMVWFSFVFIVDFNQKNIRKFVKFYNIFMMTIRKISKILLVFLFTFDRLETLNIYGNSLSVQYQSDYENMLEKFNLNNQIHV